MAVAARDCAPFARSVPGVVGSAAVDPPVAVDRYAVVSDAGMLLVKGGKLTVAAMCLPTPDRGAFLRRYWQR
eukprot:7196169-Pyramimonas_sp.AAC.1